MQGVFQKISAFFMSIIAFFAGLFGLNKKPADPAPEEPTMITEPVEITVMTFNIQHFENINTGLVDIEAYADYIRESGASVVGLNEVFEDQLAELAETLGWESFFACGCDFGGRQYGNGIVSCLPLLEAKAVTIPDPEVQSYDGYYETRALIACTVDVDGKELHILCTHFGLNPDEAENGVNTVLAYMQNERQILMGDFNLRPEDPLLDPIRSRMCDTAPLLGENCLTFPADAPDRKLDYIFLSADLTAVSADIPPLVLSDHRPYRCTVRFY